MYNVWMTWAGAQLHDKSTSGWQSLLAAHSTARNISKGVTVWLASFILLALHCFDYNEVLSTTLNIFANISAFQNPIFAIQI